jgi:flagellar protein FlgJ
MNNAVGITTDKHPKPLTASSQTAVKGIKLRQACADFESIFIHYILKSARKAHPKSGIFDSTHEGEIYKAMMDQQMAQSAAKGRGMGLGRMLYEQLNKDNAKP